MKKRQGWLFFDEPSLREFEISETQVALTIFLLLSVGVLWITLAFLIGKPEFAGRKIIFVSISCLVVFFCSYIFEGQNNQDSESSILLREYKVRFLSLSLITPPLLIVYASEFQEQNNLSLVGAITVLLFHLFYWSFGLSKEIEDDSIFIKISSISTLLTIFSQIAILLPEKINQTIFNLFPYYPPFLLIWNSQILNIVRLIGFIVVSGLSLAYSINVTLKYTSINSIKYTEFNKISKSDNNGILYKIYNSFVEVFNSIFVPIFELFIHLLKLAIKYAISISSNFFNKITEIFSSSIQIFLLFMRFLLLPLIFAGFISFLVWQISGQLYNYIHITDDWFKELVFILEYLIILIIIPFCLLISWSFKIVLKTTISFLEIVLMPHILVIMLLPIFSFLLINMNIKPYYFGVLSLISSGIWIFGGTIFVRKILIKKE